MTKRRSNTSHGSTAERLDWDGLQSYWESHADGDGQLDLDADPDALGNVVWPGQPLWLNAHISSLQEPVYTSLLTRIPTRLGHRALDVGCGSGRWSRVLAGHGYDVTGIDLQTALIELNRARYPDLQFHRVAFQDFVADHQFELVSSVTVLQHNPAEHHDRLARRMRELLVTGGHALVLENVHDQASHVFSRSVGGWAEVFEQGGFRMLACQPYDYSPFLRIVMWARRLEPTARARQRQGSDRGPGAVPLSPRWATIRDSALRMAVRLDRPSDAALTRLSLRRGSIHCGFLFQAI